MLKINDYSVMQAMGVSDFDETKKRGVIIGYKRIELQSEIIEFWTICLLQDLASHGKTLTVAAGGFAFAPCLGYVQLADGIYNLGQCSALSLFSQHPVGNMLYPAVRDPICYLRHCIGPNIATMRHDGS